MDQAHPVIPDRVLAYTGRLADLVAAACDGRLRATYLHGSAALGGWIPGRSDVDLLFIIADGVGDPAAPPLTAVAQVLSAAGADCPGRDLECSVVTAGQAQRPRSPWPFVLHVVAGPDSATAKVVPGNPLSGDRDLLMHYAVCRSAGWPVSGPPPRDLVGAIPRSLALGHLADEMDWGLEYAPEAYSVLNACRALIFLADDAIVSKIAGAEAALHRGLGPPDLVRRALRQQRGQTPDQPAASDAIDYVRATAAALRSGAAQAAEADA